MHINLDHRETKALFWQEPNKKSPSIQMRIKDCEWSDRLCLDNAGLIYFSLPIKKKTREYKLMTMEIQIKDMSHLVILKESDQVVPIKFYNKFRNLSFEIS